MSEGKEEKPAESEAEQVGKKEVKKKSKGQLKKEKLKKKKDVPEGTSTLAKLAAAKAAKHKEEEEKRRLEEEQHEKELEEERQREQEIERKRKEEEDIRIAALKAKYQEDKKRGLILTDKERKGQEKMGIMRQQLASQLAMQRPGQAEEEAKAPKKAFVVNSKKRKGKKDGHKPDEKKSEAEPKKEEAKKEEEAKKAPEVPAAVQKPVVPAKEENWEDLLNNPEELEKAVRPKMSMDDAEDEKPVPAVSSESNATEVKNENKRFEDKPEEKAEMEHRPKRKAPVPMPAEEEHKGPRLRSPIICVLGHVDTGKTKLLDKIRNTKVQESEVGGITQQIGATFFPRETLARHADVMKGMIDLDLNIPGLLIIDTPGHESFSNLRNRGSSLCDFAVLLVDIMHGLENQTIESINILKKRKIPFVVALNKIDRCYNWKPLEYASSKLSYERNEACKTQFDTLTNRVIAQFAEQEINACLYWNNTDPDSFVSLVPTSAITGEGIPDILTHMVDRIQKTLKQRITDSNKLLCTVMEVKVLEGYGVTCDVILVTGELHVDDTLVLSGFDGPIVTKVRALLTPQPLKEMRVKGEYVHNESVRGTIGVKFCGTDLEQALAGSPLLRANSPDDIERLKKEAGEELMLMIRKHLSKSGEGVTVQSSTLGSLEALLELLHTIKVPVANIGLGPLFKRHILKVLKLTEMKCEKEEYATILAFEVEPDKEAKELAEKNNIKIFTEKTVYHLIEGFKKYALECLNKRKTEKGKAAVFPCLVKIVDKTTIFNSKEPIVIGVNVLAGVLKVGTPLCVPDKENLYIGRVESLEVNHKSVTSVRPKDGSVAVKVTGQPQIMVGRHFDETNQICSLITRDSLDAIKKYYKDEVTQEDVELLKKLKMLFKIA